MIKQKKNSLPSDLIKSAQMIIATSTIQIKIAFQPRFCF